MSKIKRRSGKCMACSDNSNGKFIRSQQENAPTSVNKFQPEKFQRVLHSEAGYGLWFEQCRI